MMVSCCFCKDKNIWFTGAFITGEKKNGYSDNEQSVHKLC
jgi:hypothetical protein